MNGMNRTVQEIVHVVKICGATLRKRLDEFSKTDSASLTVDNFTKVWLDTTQDPPSFAAAVALAQSEKGKRKRVDSDTSALGSSAGQSDTACGSSDGEESTDRALSVDLDGEMKAALQDVHLIKITRQLDASDCGDADLSALDDDWEVANAIITEDEVKFKSEIWESLNFEYSEMQKREWIKIL
jgi:transcription factor IIIB subunit 2